MQVVWKVVLKAHKTAGKLVEWKDVRMVLLRDNLMVVSTVEQ